MSSTFIRDAEGGSDLVVFGLKAGLEDRLRALVVGESAVVALEEWSSCLEKLEVPFFNYRGDHVVQAVHVAKQLVKETGADRDVVVMATWLHDCAQLGTEGTPDPTGLTHGEVCANKARQFLLGEGVDKTTVERVCDAIRKHGGYTLEEPIAPLESQIVWEADKLTKLGYTSIIHYIINGLRYEPNNSMQDILKRLQKAMPLWQKIAASMMTDAGKHIAKTRLQNIEEFIDRFEKELVFLD